MQETVFTVLTGTGRLVGSLSSTRFGSGGIQERELDDARQKQRNDGSLADYRLSKRVSKPFGTHLTPLPYFRFFSSGLDVSSGIPAAPANATDTERKIYYASYVADAVDLMRDLIEHPKVFILALNGPGGLKTDDLRLVCRELTFVFISSGSQRSAEEQLGSVESRISC